MESKSGNVWKPKVAIGTGPCAGGVIGFGSLYYEAVGAAPRLAERLLLYAPQLQITVCQRTAELVRSDFGQTPLVLPSVDSPPVSAFIIHSRLRAGGGESVPATQSRSLPAGPVASLSVVPQEGNEVSHQLAGEADGGSTQAEGRAKAPLAKKPEWDRAHYLANVVNRLRRRQGFREENEEDDGVGQDIGHEDAFPKQNGDEEFIRALGGLGREAELPKDSTLSITTRLADTEALAAELSDFLVEAPVARFCHLLPFPRESVLDPLYHRWRERSDHIDGTVGTASVFLFYTTVLIALLVDAREQIVGLVLFCVAYLIAALRLCAKFFVKRASAVETVLSLFLVETLGLGSLSLIYYEKKTKPLPHRENLV